MGGEGGYGEFEIPIVGGKDLSAEVGIVEAGDGLEVGQFVLKSIRHGCCFFLRRDQSRKDSQSSYYPGVRVSRAEGRKGRLDSTRPSLFWVSLFVSFSSFLLAGGFGCNYKDGSGSRLHAKRVSFGLYPYPNLLASMARMPPTRLWVARPTYRPREQM